MLASGSRPFPDTRDRNRKTSVSVAGTYEKRLELTIPGATS
jgi:hypothetical protein